MGLLWCLKVRPGFPAGRMDCRAKKIEIAGQGPYAGRQSVALKVLNGGWDVPEVLWAERPAA